MKSITLMIGIIYSIFLSTGCTKPNLKTATSNSPGTTTAGINQVPSMTGSVTTTSGVIGSKEDRNFTQRLANNGVIISQTEGNVSFAATDSPAMCETVNIFKSIINQVAAPDRVLCYLKALATNNIIPTNFADGAFHYVSFNNVPSQNNNWSATPLVKFKLSLNSGGTLANFTMYSCFGGTTAAPVQTDYLSVANTSGTVSVVAKSLNTSSSSGSFGHSTTVNGTMNTSGNWINSKTMTATNYSAVGGNSFNMYMNLVQGSNTATISAYRNGSFSNSGSNQTFSNSIYAVTQLLNANTLSTLAIGDGSALFSLVSGFGGSTWSSGKQSTSWSGDSKATLSPASNGSFYSNVASATLLTVPGNVTPVTFTTNVDAWDCTLSNTGIWSVADFNSGGTPLTTAINACNNNYAIGVNWVDCTATNHN